MSSPYTGVQQLARFTLTLSIPLTIISVSKSFGDTFTTLGVGLVSTLSIIFIIEFGVFLPLPADKYISS